MTTTADAEAMARRRDPATSPVPAVLHTASETLRAHGHNPDAVFGGDDLAGYTIIGAVDRAVRAVVNTPGGLREWVTGSVAVTYVLAALGLDPDYYSVPQARQKVDAVAADHTTTWALDILDKAHLAACRSTARAPVGAVI